jgi:hypothetical protein
MDLFILLSWRWVQRRALYIIWHGITGAFSLDESHNTEYEDNRRNIIFEGNLAHQIELSFTVIQLNTRSVSI